MKIQIWLSMIHVLFNEKKDFDRNKKKHRKINLSKNDI